MVIMAMGLAMGTASIWKLIYESIISLDWWHPGPLYIIAGLITCFTGGMVAGIIAIWSPRFCKMFW
jgi:hypothetical protein